MNNKSEFYKTLTKQEFKEFEVKKIGLDSRYYLEWGNDTSYTIVSVEEDVRKILTRHLDRIIGILPLQASANLGKFVSIGADNSIQISRNDGTQVASLNHFEERIIGVQEFPDGSLAVVTDDGKLTFCDPKKGKHISEIKTKVNNLEDIYILYDQSAVFVRAADDATIWTFDGDHIVTLKGIKSNLQKAIRLSSRNWLIWTEEGKASLWSHEGHILTRFDFNIDSSDGYVELADGHILIRVSRATISLYDAEGKLLHQHSTNSELSTILTELNESREKSTKQIKSKPNIDHYIHYRNFFSTKEDAFVPIEEIAEQDLDLLPGSNKRKVWDFFNRPDSWTLRTVLKEQVKNCRANEKVLNELHIKTESKLTTYLGKVKFRRVMTWLLFIGVISTSLLAAYGFANPKELADFYTKFDITISPNQIPGDIIAAIPAGIFIWLWLIFAMRLSSAKKGVKSALSDLEVQKMLLSGNHQLISHIKHYRRTLVNQIPVLQPGQQDLYVGDFIRDYVDEMLNGKLKKMAMQECGIEQEDIVFRAHEPIILPSWSLIQDKAKRTAVESKLHPSNEYSVRIVKGGNMVSAVQFIQFIFLTKDKIDVFTMYYDFIADKAVGKEANAFFYKDVTNIGKREVDRQGLSAGNKDISATEIILSVSSGEKISLTILNEDSISIINQQAKDSESISPDMEIKRLTQEKEAIEGDSNLSEEDKEDELQAIDLRMKDAVASRQQAEIAEVENKAEEAIKNIRNQLKQHKKEIA